jgi:hypothetical protein
MKLGHWRRGAALLLGLAALSLLLWGLWPVGQGAGSLLLKLTPPGGPASAQALTCTWPARLRTGDTAQVHLTLASPASGTPTTAGAPVTVLDLSATHHVVAQAHLEAAGLSIEPRDPRGQPLPAGQDLTFAWQVSVPTAARYRGTLWLKLLAYPKTGGAATEIPVLARRIEIEGRSLLGLSGPLVRALGGLSAVGAFTLCLDDLFRLVHPRPGRQPGLPKDNCNAND